MRRTGSPVLVVLAAAALVLTWSSGAAAHHKADHTEGPPATGAGSEVTEDTDSDGVPNAPDPLGDTDNRHPSGKDKHAEAGGSGNQGNAASEPDANGHGPERDAGGVDQPGGPGGLDVLDQDGNNGCGNDDDFEDDNEGRCLGKEQAPGQQTQVEQEIVPPAVVPVVSVTTEVGGEVAPAAQVGAEIVTSAGPGGAGQGGAQGLRETVAGRGAGVGALAFTGANALPLLAVSAGLALLGGTLLILGRRKP
jgi:hypothetical protein